MCTIHYFGNDPGPKGRVIVDRIVTIGKVTRCASPKSEEEKMCDEDDVDARLSRGGEQGHPGVNGQYIKEDGSGALPST